MYPPCLHSQHDACYTSHVTVSVIGFHWEMYSLSAVVCRQSCIHPHDRNSGCWFLLMFFSRSSPESVDYFFLKMLRLLHKWKKIQMMQADIHISWRWDATFRYQMPELPTWQRIFHLLCFHTVIECHTTHQHSLCFTQSMTRRQNADHFTLHFLVSHSGLIQ